MKYKVIRYIDQLGDTFKTVMGESDSLVDIEFARDFLEANFPRECDTDGRPRGVDYTYTVERE